MNNSGDAAEQIVRMSLEGTEVALKLTGAAAKNIGAAIIALLKNKDSNKVKGRQNLTAMLKSGKELKVFTIDQKHLKRFQEEARRYGVVYSALRERGKSNDGVVDVMVRAEDASKINRIVERFKFATVDQVSIKHDVEMEKAEKDNTPKPPEHTAPEKSDEDKLLDDMLSKPQKKDEPTQSNPTAARTGKSDPSAPTSKKQNRYAEGASKNKSNKPSVRKELHDITERRNKQKQKEKEKGAPKRDDRSRNKKPYNKQRYNEHKQPAQKKKSKSKTR